MTTWLESLVFKLEPTNLPKSVGSFFWEWKTSPAKSTGFRIQLLSTENRRYQKNTPLMMTDSKILCDSDGKYDNNERFC